MKATKKDLYVAPSVEVVNIIANDIITTSISEGEWDPAVEE